MMTKRSYYQSRKQTGWQVGRKWLDNTGYDLKYHADIAVDKTEQVTRICHIFKILIH